MIAIHHPLIRQVRAVLRKSVLATGLRYIVPPVVLKTDSEALCILAGQTDVIVQYRQPGEFETESLSLPATALSDFEGRGDDLVSLEKKDAKQVVASWSDGPRRPPQTIRRFR